MKQLIPIQFALLLLLLAPRGGVGSCPDILVSMGAIPDICLGETMEISADHYEIPGNCNGLTTFPYKRWYWHVEDVMADPASGRGRLAKFTPLGSGSGKVVFDLVCRSTACPDCNAEFRDEQSFDVIHVDIVQTEEYVCADDTSATLNLTGDSYSPSGFLWTSRPHGITGSGTSVSFNPSQLTPRTYDVTAKAAQSPTCPDTCVVHVIKVDIVDDEVFKCNWNSTSASLLLTSDSYSPHGYVWTVDPPQGLSWSTAGSSFTYDPGLSTPNTYVVKAASYDLADCDDEATVHIVETDNIDATSPFSESSANPPPFAGHTPWPFDVTLSPDPGKHMVVFYKDVVDASFNVQDFDVTLKANVLPTSISANQLCEVWSKVSGPASGNLDRTDTFEVNYQNPKLGGIYRFDFDLGLSGPPKSEVNVVLPLAGAEVDSIVSADIGRADAFAAEVIAEYQEWERNWVPNLKKWFWIDGAGDYLGRPDNNSYKTVWAYNEVDADGYSAVSTWKGKPIRVAKLSNFIIAYAARKIGVWTATAHAMQLGGTPNDASATKSWNAGWALGGGAGTYDTTVANLVADIWDDDADPTQKNMKLWPNTAICDNFTSPLGGFNPSLHFTSPKFLYMSNP